MAWKKLNVNDLNDWIANKKSTISKKEVALRLNMTETGLQRSIIKQSIKLTTFQDMCEILGTNPCVFFDPLYKGSDDLMEESGEDVIPRAFHNELVECLRSEINYLRELNLKLAEVKRGEHRCG